MSDRQRFVIGAFIVTGIGFFVAMNCGAAPQTPQHPPVSEQKLISALSGKELFAAYCASCHGQDARGRGVVAPELKSKVPDLTRIAISNSGVFPRERVRSTIDGEPRPVAHGTRAMPVWGPFFSQVEGDADFGKVRVDNLVRYLESLQEQPPAPKKR